MSDLEDTETRGILRLEPDIDALTDQKKKKKRKHKHHKHKKEKVIEKEDERLEKQERYGCNISSYISINIDGY